MNLNLILTCNINTIFTAISRKVEKLSVIMSGKLTLGAPDNVHATISKANMGYDQFAVPDTVAVKPNLLLSF